MTGSTSAGISGTKTDPKSPKQQIKKTFQGKKRLFYQKFHRAKKNCPDLLYPNFLVPVRFWDLKQRFHSALKKKRLKSHRKSSLKEMLAPIFLLANWYQNNQTNLKHRLLYTMFSNSWKYQNAFQTKVIKIRQMLSWAPQQTTARVV